MSFPDAFIEAHSSFINFKATTTSSPEDLSGLSATPGSNTWNGWITDKAGNQVMWIPEEYRDSVLRQGMIKLFGRERLTVDFSNAYHGTDWIRCYQPRTYI